MLTVKTSFLCASFIRRGRPSSNASCASASASTPPKRLKGFLESAVCGPWVVELWYIYNKVSSDEMEESLAAVGENEKSHWDLLAELLTRLPNLRFLSVELNDKPDSYSEQEKTRKELEKKEASQALSENASATRDDDSYEKVCREEGFEYSGVRDVLNAIGKLSNLEGLVLLCDAVHIERFKSISTRSSRYFPYFALVCQQLPNLTSLKYLHIRGWSGWYDMEADEEPEYEDFRRDEADEEEEDGEEKSKVRVDKEPLSECLVDKSPPASLKTLVLELPHYRFPTSHIKWLQVPQGNYAVENLFVRFNVDCNFMHAICWSGALGEMSRADLALMPALKNVRLEFPDKGLSGIGHVAEFERMLRQGISKLLSQRLTNVRTLQAAPIFLDATVPPTLDELHIVLDRVRYEPRSMWTDRNNRDEIWQRRDRTIKDLLCDMRHQILERRVVVTSMDTEDAIEDVLPNTIGYCDDVGIDLYTADERGVHNRICDFLLLGQVQ